MGGLSAQRGAAGVMEVPANIPVQHSCTFGGESKLKCRSGIQDPQFLC